MRSYKVIVSEAVCVLMLAYTSGIAAEAAPGPNEAGTKEKAPSASLFGNRDVPIEGEFGEGWRQTVVLPASSSLGAGGQVTLSVEEGWLCVRHDSADGQLEWHIVLCQIEDNVFPEVEVIDGIPFFVDISYRDGRYFVREAHDIFRALRESVSGKKLLARETLSPDARSSGSGMSPRLGLTSTSWNDNGWFLVAAGPERESWRAVVRLNPTEEHGQGFGVSTSAGYIKHHHGDKWLIDDGELIVANRTSTAMYEAIKKHEAARAAILAGRLPAIEATDWLNSDRAPTWESLRGKVVLVDFWATWCGPCVAKLPDSQRLHEEYENQGLVVIGIHSLQDADTCAAFLKENGYTFPVALDSGKTADGFAISGWPSYFLVDRSGKVVQGFKHEPPSDDTIKALLNGMEP